MVAGARDQVGQRRGHLRHRPDRPEADGGPADPPGRRGRRAAAQARPVGAHGDDQGAPARLHHPQPLHHAPLPHRQQRRRSPGSPAALLTDLDTSGGVRLLGVGVSGLADWIQEDLFGETTRGGRDLPDESSSRRRAPAPHLGAGHGRRARRDGPRLGVGLGPGRGDRALRDRRDPPPGPVPLATPDRTTRPQRRGARRSRQRIHRGEPHLVARPELRALPQVVGSTTTPTTG